MIERKGDEDAIKSSESNCQVCRKECRPLRCTRCRQAWYCSKDCQKIGWKTGHRTVCGTGKSEQRTQAARSGENILPGDAMMELQALMAKNYSLDTLSNDYHKAKNEMEREKVETTSSVERKQPEDEKKTKIQSTAIPSKAKAPKDPFTSPAGKRSTSSQKACTDSSRIYSAELSYWEFWVECLNNISSYHIILRPKPSQVQNNISLSTFVDQLEMSVTVSGDRQSSIVSLRQRGRQTGGGNSHHPILYVKLPGKVDPNPSAFDIQEDFHVGMKTRIGGSSLSLRLKYEASLEQQQGLDDLGSSSLLSTGLDTSSANHLHCKFCLLSILRENVTINRVVRIPSSNWDDIADYLICYSGQATIDFTTASTNAAQSGAVLVDTNAILLHGDDVGSSVCVLAVEGYGEEKSTSSDMDKTSAPISPFAAAADEMENDAPAIVRGPRHWRESVGGGSICCSQCCSILGFASLSSPETYRFLKHRLVSQDAPKTLDSDPARIDTSISATKLPEFVPLTSCSCFVAHEMIRYAETKAIFTFVIERNETGSEGRLLLLKLLSWDSQLATNNDAKYLESSQGQSHLIQDPCFKKTAKIIFEETEVEVIATSGTNETLHNEKEDISKWIWGGADLCCLPDATGVNTNTLDSSAARGNESGGDSAPSFQVQGGHSTSSVRLMMETNEWDELRAALQEGTQFFSKEVVDATVAAKLGHRSIPHRSGQGLKLGISVVSLEK